MRQRKLQADREHQEHDAEFSQILDTFGIGDKTRGMRADHDPGTQIAQHGRQIQDAKDHHPDHGGQEQKQGEFERRGHPYGDPIKRWGTRRLLL